MEMMRRSGQRGVPVITIDDDVIVGFDRPGLERALARHGAGGQRRAPSRPRLGAAVADAAAILAGQGKDPVPGAYLGKVSPGSVAERGGLQPGDVIVALAGHPIRGADDVEHALARTRPGAPVEVGFLRDGRRMQTRILL